MTLCKHRLAIAGPTSSRGWREEERWPALKTRRIKQPGCAKIGQKVIIAGGYNNGRAHSSTEVLDLVNRRITSGGEMSTPRLYFHVSTFSTFGGHEQLLALAGWNGSSPVDTVEEWVGESSTWRPANSLTERRHKFGAFTAPRQLVCPT